MKKTLKWAASFGALGLFTLLTIGGFVVNNSPKVYAEAIQNNSNHWNGHHKYVVVEKDQESKGLSRWFKKGSEGKMVCTISPVQAAQLDAFFRVNKFTIQVEGKNVEIATVSDRQLSKSELKNFLKASDPQLDCQIVHAGRLFFLPIVPHMS